MRRKKVRYERLLRVRKLYEDAHVFAHAQARRVLEDAIDDRSRIRDQRRAVLERVSSQDTDALRADHLRALYQYERHLSRVEARAENVIMERRRTAAEKRRALEGAFRSRQIAEKLVERADEHIGAHERKIEQRLLDELGAMRRPTVNQGGETL